MPRWTSEELRAYENRRSSSRAKPQCPVQDEPVAEAKGEGENASRVRVRIVSYRKRLVDPDNLCPKYFVDCLRYAGLLKDDSARHVALTVEQIKVKAGGERTEIELT